MDKFTRDFVKDITKLLFFGFLFLTSGTVITTVIFSALSYIDNYGISFYLKSGLQNQFSNRVDVAIFVFAIFILVISLSKLKKNLQAS